MMSKKSFSIKVLVIVGLCSIIIKNNYENLYEEYRNTGTKIHANRSLFNTILNNLKAENEFLTCNASTSLQCAYEDLIQSFKNFIRKLKNGEIKIMQAKFLDKHKGETLTDKQWVKYYNLGSPNWRSKHGNSQSFKIKNNKDIKIIDAYLKVPKNKKYIRMRYHRKCNGDILSVTISKKANKWYDSINVKNSPVKPLDLTGYVLGIDTGVKNPIITSDGFKLDKFNFKNLDNKIVRLHKKLSNQVFNSHNYQKTKTKLQIAYDKKRNITDNIIHKFTYNLVKNYDKISFGDISLQWLLSNHKLAKTVADQKIGEIKRQLSYKADWYGKIYKEVSEKLTTQTCNNCNYVFKEASNLKIRSWICPNCGVKHDRDINSAKNIRTVGLAEMDCGTTNIS